MKIQITKSEQEEFLQNINSEANWKLTIPIAFKIRQHHQFKQFESQSSLAWAMEEFSSNLYQFWEDISDFEVLADYVELKMNDLDNWDKKTGAERTGKAVREMIMFLESKGVVKRFAEEISKKALFQFKLNDIELGPSESKDASTILYKVFQEGVQHEIVDYDSEHGPAFDNLDTLEERGSLNNDTSGR